MLDLWLFDDELNDSIMIYIIKEIHLINKLRVNILLNINIQKSKNMIISISKQRFFVDNCVDFSTSINVVDVEKRVDRVILNKLILLLCSHFVTNVFIQTRDNVSLSIDWDYMFHSKISFHFEYKKNVYFYIVNVNIFIIQIRNVTNETYIISRHVKLNRVFDYEKKNCYMIISKNAYLIVKLKKQIFKISFKLTLTKLVNVSMLVDVKTSRYHWICW